ncbi:MAG: type II toxin-antitoxin system VapB family antitoxin [Hyphomicrobiaceae bacterium]
MQTTVDVDNALLANAMALTKFKTERETVEEALRLSIRLKHRESIRE